MVDILAQMKPAVQQELTGVPALEALLDDVWGPDAEERCDFQELAGCVAGRQVPEGMTPEFAGHHDTHREMLRRVLIALAGDGGHIVVGGRHGYYPDEAEGRVLVTMYGRGWNPRYVASLGAVPLAYVDGNPTRNDRRTLAFYFRPTDLGVIHASDWVDRIVADLPAVRRWALEGLDRLNARGHFTSHTPEPVPVDPRQCAADTLGVFLTGLCDRTADAVTPRDDLIAAYATWAEANGLDCPMTPNRFTRTMTKLGVRRARVDGKVSFLGVALRPGLV